MKIKVVETVLIKRVQSSIVAYAGYGVGSKSPIVYKLVFPTSRVTLNRDYLW